MNLSIWLAGQVALVTFLVLFSTVFSRASARSAQAKTLADLERNGKLVAGMMAGLFLADFLALAWLGVVIGGLSGWVMIAASALVVAWVIWNWPTKRRLIVVDAETNIAGDPYKLSAFFADVKAETRWQTGLLSSVSEGMSVQGPRFHLVGIIPGTKRQIEGDAVLRVNEPGKEVVIGTEGAGVTADQFLLSPSGSGTHVLYRTVLEMPFLMALAGGMFLAGDKDRPVRHTNELARAKAVFEAANTQPS
jgi:hypothetical protein